MLCEKAYAKVNLMLKVIGKRANGYHDLQMLNAKINLYDEITIKEDIEDRVFFDVDCISDEFILKVLKSFKEKFQVTACYNIYIKKRIPIGAGLGGGSADASLVIDMLLKMNRLVVSNQEKVLLFKDLGADIPYCFYQEIAIVEGIGDKIFLLDEKNKKLINKNIVLVYPNISVSTKEVFRNNKKISTKLTMDEIKKNIYDNNFINDLETSTFEIYPPLAKLKQELSEYGKVVMSGSGSTLLVYTKEIDAIKNKYCDYLILPVEII